MIEIFAVLCTLSSPATCHEQTVTTSDFADVSMQSCLMGAPQLADDPRFRTNGDRNRHEAELRQLIAGFIGGLTRDEALLERMVVQGRRPKLAIGVEVRECFLHCAKAFRRSGLWDSTRW